MNLSIVIVNYRSWDCLDDCLQRLGLDSAGRPWEVVVVDNHSSDGRFNEFANRYPGVRFIETRWNGGFAFGCNRGAAESAGRTLLFLNPDVVPDPGSVSHLLQIKARHPEIAILSASQVDGRGRLRKVFDVFPDKLTWSPTVKFLLRKLRPRRFRDPRQPFTGLVECDWVSGSVLMIDRADFERLGGWREDYWMYVEDCDLCLRARRAGLGVACSGDVRMTHAHGGSSRQNYGVSVLTRTEGVISKHLYVHLNFRGINRVANHVCVFLAIVPKLAVFSLFDLLTLRRSETLKTRSAVLAGVFRHYASVIRRRDWRSRQLARGAKPA